MEIRGRDAVSGLPRTVEINQKQVAEALDESVRAIMHTVRAVLEKTPPELSATSWIRASCSPGAEPP